MTSPDSNNHPDRIKGILDKLTPDDAQEILQVICQDQLTDLYKRAFFVYAMALALILLWPFDFTFIDRKNHVRWNDASPGIEFTGEGQVISDSMSRPLFERLVNGRGFSLEVWIHPANHHQVGPARIVSYSLNPNYRNFTLAQQGPDLVMRLRTEQTDLNGLEPMLTVKDVFISPKPLHIVVSYDFQEQRVFVNGHLWTTRPVPGGNFNNWDPGHRLVLGNEASGDRPWLGKLSYVAIYDHPLYAQEILKSYHDVSAWISGNFEMSAPRRGLVVRYLLDEKNGVGVSDSGTLAEPLTLYIPDTIKTESKPFLGFSLDRLPDLGSKASYEMMLNVLLFIPFGFLFHAVLSTHIDGNWRPLFGVITAGGAIPLSVEILQYFSQSRNSSLVDVIANLIGVMLGLQLKLMVDTVLKNNKKMIKKTDDFYR